MCRSDTFMLTRNGSRRDKRPALSRQSAAPTPVITLRERIKGLGPSTASRLVLFAHYDPDGIVDDHIVYQISALVKAGCSVVVITSTNREDELKKLIPLASIYSSGTTLVEISDLGILLCRFYGTSLTLMIMLFG